MVELSGFRMRSTGFALTATLDQVRAIDENAKLAAKAIEKAGKDGKAGKASGKIWAELGKSMGLENVFFHERRFDPDKEWVDEKGQTRLGDYTDDAMSLGEKSENLLRTWAAAPQQGAVVLTWRKDRPDEKPADPLNPLTGQNWRKTRDEEFDAEIEDKATKEKRTVRMVRRLVLGDEAVVASKLGALGLYRKMFQRLMEDILATVTRKNA